MPAITEQPLHKKLAEAPKKAREKVKKINKGEDVDVAQRPLIQ